MQTPLPRGLRTCFLVVDLGFILYWAVTALSLLPPEWLFEDYRDPILTAWNWSFMPLDLLISASGISSLVLHARGDARYRAVALVSLALTTASGLQAISFWALRSDFELAWWAPNLFLLLYPAFYAAPLLRSESSV